MRQDWQQLIDETVKDETLHDAYAWQPFAKGSSNSIFLGTLKNNPNDNLKKTVVLRINAPPKDTPGVVRQRESAILNLIQPFAWAPQIISNEPNQGWCLMHHYESIDPAEKSAERLTDLNQTQLFAALNELHSISVTSNELRYDYEALLNDTYQPIAIKQQDKQAIEWIETIRCDLVTLPKLPSCLVHHDIHIGNLVLAKSPENDKSNAQLVILDWEYAAIGNPWFDASCLSRYLSMPADYIYSLTLFKTLDQATFKDGLQQADRMTEILQKLWYWARE